MDPITLEVLWNRLLAVVNEQQVALMRTAFSTVVRETQDLACGVFDARGRMIAQSLTGTPGHINAMATGVRHFLSAYPPAALALKISGHVVLSCVASAEGAVRDCQVKSEQPHNWGFGDTALTLASLFRIRGSFSRK